MSKPRWKYAIGQHPMWLIIAEDTVCAERTPPWGSPTLRSTPHAGQVAGLARALP